MSDLQEISRVVYRHDWTSIDQWVSTLDQLADLTEDEIVELARLGNRPLPCARKTDGRRAVLRRAAKGGRSSLASWAHVGFWTHAMISLRRGWRMISLF
jgi:hypothetical protein